VIIRRFTLDSELRRMARQCKDPGDRYTLERAAKAIKEYSATEHKSADVLELERMLRLIDPRP